MTDGLVSAIQGIACSFDTISARITRLKIEISDSWDFVRPPAPFAGLCQSLLGLNHLQIRALPIEHKDWTTFDLPGYRLETLSLVCSPHALDFFLGSSAPSLRGLELSSALPDRPLDLRTFTSLQELEMCCEYYDMASRRKEYTSAVRRVGRQADGRSGRGSRRVGGKCCRGGEDE